MTVAARPARGDEGALAAVLPADAWALWVDDPDLALTLQGDGYRLVDDQPDAVVVTSARGLRWAPAAPTAIALLDGNRVVPTADGRAHDAAARLLANVRVRAATAVAVRLLRRGGPGTITTGDWDHSRPLELGAGAPVDRRRPVDRYPRRALAVRTAGGGPSVLEAAVRAATGGDVLAAPLGRPVVAGGGTLLVPLREGMLRLGIAAGRDQVLGPAAVLREVASGAPDGALAGRVPRLLREGAVGPASWTLEQLMPGQAASAPLPPSVLDQSVEFLLALHGVAGDPSSSAESLLQDAATVRSLAHAGGAVEELAVSAADVVADLPRGYGHGDFWHHNLLVSASGELAAVVDWDSAASGRLPFLDLMHLVTSQQQLPGPHNWGRAVVEALLPWAAGGGDAWARRFGRGIGVPVTPRLLTALVTAYWLDWLAYQLTHYAGRRADARWLQGNVRLVRDVLSRQPSP